MRALYAYLMTRKPVAYASRTRHLPWFVSSRQLLGLWKAGRFVSGRYQYDAGHTDDWIRGACQVVDITKKSLVLWLFPVYAGYTLATEKHVYNNSAPGSGKLRQQFTDMPRSSGTAGDWRTGMTIALPGHR